MTNEMNNHPIALSDLIKTVELPGVDRAKLQGFVDAGIAKIFRHQHDDGAFGLWPEAHAEPHLTAYALWGLYESRRAGYKVETAIAVVAAVPSLGQAPVGGGGAVAIVPFTGPILLGVTVYEQGYTPATAATLSS